MVKQNSIILKGLLVLFSIAAVIWETRVRKGINRYHNKTNIYQVGSFYLPFQEKLKYQFLK